MPENLVEKDLQLLSINGVTELETGEFALALNFGKIIENSPEIASRLENQGNINPLGPKQVATSTMIIYVKSNHAKPFSVGSDWKLSISAEGRITLEPK
jgi:hypothetical protein